MNHFVYSIAFTLLSVTCVINHPSISINLLCVTCQLKYPCDTVSENQEVKISDWGQVTFLFAQNYWEDKASLIIPQIGKAEYELVKRFSHHTNIPGEMLIYSNGKKKETKTFYKKKSSLRQYRIATFWQKRTDSDVKEKISIIRVPYKGNEAWDVNVRWDSVYFVIKDEFVEPI